MLSLEPMLYLCIIVLQILNNTNIDVIYFDHANYLLLFVKYFMYNKLPWIINFQLVLPYQPVVQTSSYISIYRMESKSIHKRNVEPLLQ